MTDQVTIEQMYNIACNTPSDINQHLCLHRKLAEKCNSICEVGVRSFVSGWALLMGLKPGSTYIGVDLEYPPEETFNLAKKLAEEKGITFRFIAQDDMTINPDDIGEVDMLFIDSLHTYSHLSFEVETFHRLAKKFLTFHDCSGFPWEFLDDYDYKGDYSEYPSWIDTKKRGVWPAIQDFMVRHPEWKLKERYHNNHGFGLLVKSDVNNVYPISFSIPKEKIIKTSPEKKRIMSLMIPGDMSTYIYNTEEDYYKQYQESYFALTMKKRGNDCLRHYEIIANGCIPVYKDIESCPENTMFSYPKQLQIEANEFYSSAMYLEPGDKQLDEKYSILQGKFLDHMRKNLTTEKMASYVLNKSGNPSARKILYLMSDPNPDYLHCLTLHGLKRLFGANCHDFPKANFMYKGEGGQHLYGKGITYSGLLEHELHINVGGFYAMEDLIAKKYFDVIIYGNMTKGMQFYGTVLKHYPPEKIIYFHGDDEMVERNFFPKSKSHIFARELI